MKDIEQSRIDKIRALHVEISGFLKMTLDRAIKIGGLLQEQKGELNHGEFIPWIKENCPFSERLARDYIRFYDNRDELKTAKVADLTEARKYLTPPDEPTEKTEGEIIEQEAKEISVLKKYIEDVLELSLIHI